MDGAGRAYIAGNEDEYLLHSLYVYQACFPTTSGAVIGGTQPGGGDPQYAFVAAFDPTGAQLLYSTLFGDPNFQCTIGCGGPTYGTGVAVDANGYFYLVGETEASTLPTTAGVVQPTGAPLGNPANAMCRPGAASSRSSIRSLPPVGHRWPTPPTLAGKLGNTGDYISGITIDSASNAYIVGYTNSPDFPVTSRRLFDRLRSEWAELRGGPRDQAESYRQRHPLVHLCGRQQGDGERRVVLYRPHPVGWERERLYHGASRTRVSHWSIPFEPAGNGGDMQVLVAELDPTGANLLFSTHIGSGGLDTANPAGLAVDSAGNIYLAGNTRRPGPDHDSRRIPDDRQQQRLLLPRLCR